MAASTQRRVRHLRIRAPTPDAARHLTTSLEDALRTASLPAAEDSRLLLIRRLNLGVLPHGASPSTLALSLEAAVRALAIHALDAESPLAPQADAVTFPDRSTALLAAARNLARGTPLTDWFWTAALPGLQPDQPAPVLWQHLLQLAQSCPAPVLTAARLTAFAMRSLHAVAFANSLDPIAATQLLQALGPWPVPASPQPTDPEPASHPPEIPIPVPDLIPSPILDHLIRVWSVNDPRLVWIAAALTLDAHPTRTAHPALPARILATLSSRSPDPIATETPRPTQLPSPHPSQPQSVITDRHPDSDPSPSAPPEVTKVTAPPVADRASQISHSTPPPAPTNAPVPAEDVPVSTTPPPLPAQPTVLGGLLFLIPILNRLGLPAFLANHPDLIEAAFAPQLLLDIAQRCLRSQNLHRAKPYPCSKEESDGAADSWAGREVSEARIGTEMRNERTTKPRPRRSSQHDRAYCMVTAKDPLLSQIHPNGILTPTLTPALASWRIRLRRACRLELHLGLAHLVLRPARLRATATHWDLILGLDQIDLRIRRAALDLDPGWVPWLGRVVQFHYRTPQSLASGFS